MIPTLFVRGTHDPKNDKRQYMLINIILVIIDFLRTQLKYFCTKESGILFELEIFYVTFFWVKIKQSTSRFHLWIWAYLTQRMSFHRSLPVAEKNRHLWRKWKTQAQTHHTTPTGITRFKDSLRIHHMHWVNTWVTERHWSNFFLSSKSECIPKALVTVRFLIPNLFVLICVGTVLLKSLVSQRIRAQLQSARALQMQIHETAVLRVLWNDFPPLLHPAALGKPSG